MGGLFGSDDDVPDSVVQTYEVKEAKPKFTPINFVQLYDDLTGDEFTFVRGQDSNRYLELREKRDDYRHQTSLPKDSRRYPISTQGYTELADDKEREMNKYDIIEPYRFNQKHGVNPGELKVNIQNRRINIDNPIDSKISQEITNDIALINNVTNQLQKLNETINVMRESDPLLVKENQGLIKAFTESTQKARERGFDIRRNGMMEKLKAWGLDNSSTAIGAEIMLQSDKVRQESDDNLKLMMSAQGWKKDSMQQAFVLGNQYVQDRQQSIAKYNVDLNKDTQNRQLQQRQHELRRQTLLGLMGQGNNMNMQALQAITQDNSANSQRMVNSLNHDQHNLERYKVEQLANTNPWGQIAMKGLGMGVNAMMGGFGGNLGGALTEKLGMEILNNKK